MKSLYLIFILFCFVKADEEVICPDFRSKCPGGTTCCTLDSGDFGCCPLPKAVCCSDHVHCCPENNKCDVERQLCLHTNEGGIIIPQPLRRKVPSTKMYEVICPDGKHSCPAHHTCCPIGSKKQFWKNVQYGCCPAEKAVCCSDHLHCCPHGTECDISEARCLIPPILRETEIRKLPPFSIQHKKDVPERRIKADTMEPAVRLCGLQFIKTITSPVRAQKFCPVSTKCCSYPYYDDEIGTIYERELGCCPFKDGNCCRYSRKCCPKGFECTNDNKCISIENYESQEEKEEKEVVEPISTSEHYEYPSLFPSLPSCPDRSKCVPRGDITSRKDTTTCCPRYDNNKLVVGYDCCPEKKANCCSNRTCCPYGYACTNSSKNGNVSSCRRMTMKEVIAKLFLH